MFSVVVIARIGDFFGNGPNIDYDMEDSSDSEVNDDVV
jgi:hypothetical protein